MAPQGKAMPSSQPSLVEELATLLRERIYSQRYAPGSWLRQEHLSAELGVSRTPLRESFRLLEQEGLVRVIPRKGAQVVSGESETLLAAYQLRAVVDGLAARLTAEQIDSTAARHLRRAIADQQSALAPWHARAYTDANVDFHEQIIRFSRNGFVVGQLPILRMTAQVFAPTAMIQREAAARAIGEHEAIVDAIEAGDGVGAETLARQHIQATIDQLKAGERAP